jgi:hypothetical protein
VNGFCKEVLQALPMEFAMEAQQLVAISAWGRFSLCQVLKVPGQGRRCLRRAARWAGDGAPADQHRQACAEIHRDLHLERSRSGGIPRQRQIRRAWYRAGHEFLRCASEICRPARRQPRLLGWGRSVTPWGDTAMMTSSRGRPARASSWARDPWGERLSRCVCRHHRHSRRALGAPMRKSLASARHGA